LVAAPSFWYSRTGWGKAELERKKTAIKVRSGGNLRIATSRLIRFVFAKNLVFSGEIARLAGNFPGKATMNRSKIAPPKFVSTGK